MKTRPVYIWGPQLFWVEHMFECGPCELFELTALAEAFAFTPTIAAHSVAGAIGFVREGLAEDLILTDLGERLQRELPFEKLPGLHRWIEAVDASSMRADDRAKIIRHLTSTPADFESASRDAGEYFSLFLREGYDVLPYVEYAVPALSACHRNSLAGSLLGTIDASLRPQLQRLAEFSSSRLIDVAPVTALLLSRCRTPEDIPSKLLELRREFTSLRKEIAKYEAALEDTQSLGDQLDALHDLERAQQRITKAVVTSEGLTPTKSFLRHVWEIGKQGSVLKSATKSIDVLTEVFSQRKPRRLAAHFVDVYRQLRDVKDYFRLVEKVFGHNNVAYQAFAEFETVNSTLNSLHSSPLDRLPSPPR